LAAGPKELKLGKPPGQGDSLLFPGRTRLLLHPWALGKGGPLLPDGGDDPALQREQAGTPTKVGDYSLDGHYCNAAAAATALCRGGRTRTRRSARSGRRGQADAKAGPRVIRALQLELSSKDYAFQRRDEKLGEVQHQLQPQQGA
jgi:hypothetical protein